VLLTPLSSALILTARSVTDRAQVTCPQHRSSCTDCATDVEPHTIPHVASTKVTPLTVVRNAVALVGTPLPVLLCSCGSAKRGRLSITPPAHLATPTHVLHPTDLHSLRTPPTPVLAPSSSSPRCATELCDSARPPSSSRSPSSCPACLCCIRLRRISLSSTRVLRSLRTRACSTSSGRAPRGVSGARRTSGKFGPHTTSATPGPRYSPRMRSHALHSSPTRPLTCRLL
jgi:hypothetical protein